MSENKYIIDKDSLTGIADAVRDKLGTGEATTDSQTGDIVYPEDKGYYLKQGKLAGFIYPSTKAAHYSQSEIMSVSHETILELCGNINPSFIKFTVLTTGDSRYPYRAVSKTLYNGVYFYSGEIANSSTLLNNVVGATKTFAYTGQGCYITGEDGSYSSGGGYNPYIYSYYSFPGVLQIEFLNENKQNIEAAIDGPIAGTSRYTMEIPDGEVPTKIPFSIDDIQDKITNYLTCGGILETWKLSNSQSTYLTFPSGFSAENLKDMTCLSNGYPRGLYKDSLGKPVSMIDQGISLPSSFSPIGSPLTVAKISTAHSEGRTFCIPWNWTGTKIIPDDAYFIWFIVEPNDSKIYIGSGRYANYVSIGKWTIIYT